MAQQLSLDTTFSPMRHSTNATRPATKGRRQTGADVQPSAVAEDEIMANDQAASMPRQSDRLRLVGLAGVARAREALAEAAKRAERRQLHEAA
jgi:hypothetical protein